MKLNTWSARLCYTAFCSAHANLPCFLCLCAWLQEQPNALLPFFLLAGTWVYLSVLLRADVSEFRIHVA